MIVASLVKGGAAEKGGLLRVNDKIIAVAQGDGEPVDVIDVDLQEVEATQQG
ncbi:MAG: PDZ domain-containing protein [Oligoflexus sp.]